jgi:hypothetical protein
VTFVTDRGHLNGPRFGFEAMRERPAVDRPAESRAFVVSICMGLRSSDVLEPGGAGHIGGMNMSKFVFAFKTRHDRVPGDAEEAEWGKWFQELGATVTDYGNRVGRSRQLGTTGDLGGYVVVEAGSLDAAVDIAKGCPALRHDGGVEVAEVVPSS